MDRARHEGERDSNEAQRRRAGYAVVVRASLAFVHSQSAMASSTRPMIEWM